MLRTRLFVSHEIASAIDDFFVFGCCASGFSFASKIAQSFTIFVGCAAHSAFCFAQNFLHHLRFLG
jgi:hypothetical protein